MQIAACANLLNSDMIFGHGRFNKHHQRIAIFDRRNTMCIHIGNNNMWMENYVGLSMRGRKAPHAHKNQTAELMRSNSLRITEADACKYR